MSAREESVRAFDATRGVEIVVISTVLYVILLTLVGLLVFDRLRSKHSLSIDAILVLLALTPTTFYFVATLITNDDFKWSRHMIDISPMNLDHGFKLVFASELMYVVACTLAKLSIMKLVRRIVSHASGFWRGLVVFIIGLVALQGTTSLFLVLFQCGLPANFWMSNRQECANHSASLLASCILNVLTDSAVAFLTIPCILSFRLSFRQKLIFLGFYGLGFLSMGAGILRTYFYHKATQREDFTWAYHAVWVTSALQLYPGIICATLPTTKHFFSTYFPNLLGPLSLFDHEFTSQGDQTYFGNMSGGEEELLDFEKGTMEGGSAVTIVTRRGTPALSEEDKEYIKITQQTVIEVSRVGAV